jgi:hypothetical protein
MVAVASSASALLPLLFTYPSGEVDAFCFDGLRRDFAVVRCS